LESREREGGAHMTGKDSKKVEPQPKPKETKKAPKKEKK